MKTPAAWGTTPTSAAAPPASAPVTPLALSEIEVTSVNILQEALSVHVKTETPRPEAVELLETIVRVTRGKPQRVVVRDRLERFLARARSVFSDPRR